MLFNFLDMGFAKGIPLAGFRRVLRSDSSVEGNLGFHSEEQSASAFCSVVKYHFRFTGIYYCMTKVMEVP